MSLDAISIALSGIRTTQASLAATSNNIANANTEGYTRKRVSSESVLLEGHGYGVKSSLLQRTINEYIQRDMWSQTSTNAAYKTRDTYLSQIQAFHGDPTAGASMSSEISNLKTAFQNLANRPEDTLLLNSVYTQAVKTAKRFNDYAQKITDMRNDTQREMTTAVNAINDLTTRIATYNQQIQAASGLGVSSADVADLRDQAIKELSGYISVSTYKTEGGAIQVMTSSGDMLVSTSAHQLIFNAVTVGSGSHYPTNLNGVYVDSSTGPNLTDETNLGGKLGELIKLRDDTLPTYQAQADELAQKMASRFENQGLTLFVQGDGTVPADTPATGYVGFAGVMRVNPQIVADKSLLRKGTDPTSTVASGSTAVIRRIIDYTFGSVDHQQSLGTMDLRSTAAQTKVTGSYDIASLGALDAASTHITSGAADTFTLTVGTTGPTTITIGATDTAANLVTSINTAFPGLASLNSDGKLVLQSVSNVTIGGGTLGAAGLADLGLTAGTYTQGLMGYLDLQPQARIVGSTDVTALGTLATSSFINPGTNDTLTVQLGSGTAQTITIDSDDLASDLVTKINAAFPTHDPIASLGANGQLILSAPQNITIGSGTLGTNGLNELGLTAGTTTASQPSFTIAAGLNAPTTITIDSTETATTLLAKLNAVSGVTASLDSSGYLQIVPTDGGDISLVDGLGNPLSALGMNTTSVSHTGFNSSSMGASGALSGRITTAITLGDYATQLISVQSQDANDAATGVDTSETFRSQLENQFTNDSGVNIDEEMANLITLQTAYNASANAIRIAQNMMDTLTQLFNR